MIHARADYQDKILCIQSLEELEGDIAELAIAASKAGMSSEFLSNITAKILANLHGGHIPEKEPVMLFRAQDRYAPGFVRGWAHKLGADKHPGVDVGPMVSAAVNHADLMEKWPVKKVPDMPEQKG